MGSRKISTMITLEGEAQYKQSVAGINNSLGALKLEMSQAQAEFKGSANSMDALRVKGELLNKLHEAQTDKVKEASAALEVAKKAQQEYAANVEGCAAKVAAAEARLQKLGGAAGTASKAQAEAAGTLEQYRQELADAERYNEAAQKAVYKWQNTVNSAQKAVVKLNADIWTNEQYLDEAKKSADGCATSIDQYGKKTKQAAKELKNTNDAISAMAAALAAAGITRGLKEITDGLKACVGASAEFESAITGVFKTVEGTDAQLAAISEGIKQMSTEIPATTTEIAAVAAAAGQLGIATDDVLAFSRVMLDLGESTNMTADEAATALARFANITGTSAADYERLGSVIVGLGNNFATTEAEITQMATKLASAGTLAGLTESEIMALATAMSSVGIEAEAGGTAMTQTLTAIEKTVVSGGENLEEFARISGMSVSEFKTAWETDAITAIQAFISGLGKLEKQGESATLVLDEMGLSGVRQSNMLKSLALASDTLTGAVGLANQAWTENTALTDEVNKRYETTESKLAIMNNAFANVRAAIGDALTPALREVAEAGTGAFSWAAEFIEQNPWLVQAVAGVTTTLITFTGAITGLMVINKLTAMVEGATGALSALRIVLTAHPIMAVATAIAGLTVAVGAFVSSAKEASAETRELIDGLKESHKAFDETGESVQKESDNVLAMVSALEGLVGAEHKSTAQKEALASLVDRLNESVPGLSMAYDEETNSLSDLATGAALTAESIRELARAEAERRMQAADTERLTQLYIDETTIANDLAAAQDDLAASWARTNEMMAAGTYGAMGYEMATADVDAALAAAKRTVQELTDAQADNAAEIAALDGKYQEAEQAAEELTASLVHDAAEAARTAEELKALTAETDKQTGKTRALIDETDALSAAFREQSESGGLSLDTALKLIDAGYAAAVSVDQESGAVRLNAQVYRELVRQKLEDQQATLKAQRERVQATLDLRAEAEAAADAAIAYTTLAGSKAAEAAAGDPTVSTAELEAQLKSLNAQIASMEALKNSLGSGSYGGSSKRSGGSKTNSAYKAALEELEYLRDMDEIDEAAFYDRLEALRDKYLKENSDEWRSATVKLHDYRKKAQEDAYAEELADAKYFWDLELISEADYYQRMAALRDQYLEEDSEAWRKANTELYDYLKKYRDEQLAAAKAGYEAQLAALEASLDTEKTALKNKYERRKEQAKAAYEERKTEIQRELELEKERLNAIIDGIDQEIQARRELREDQSQEDVIAKARKRLEAAQAKLAYATTDEDRDQWQKEVLRMEKALADAIQAQEDTLFYRQKEAEKDAAKEQIEAAEDAADKALDTAKRDYEATVARLESEYQSAVKRLEQQYAARVAQLESDYNRKTSAISGESTNSVRSGGGSTASLAAASSALAGAMGAAAGAVTNSLTQHITRNNSASVTINEARSLTEGQIVNAVRKVLNSMDK